MTLIYRRYSAISALPVAHHRATPSRRIPKQERAVSSRTTRVISVRSHWKCFWRPFHYGTQTKTSKGLGTIPAFIFSLFPPSPGCTGPQSLRGVPGALPQVGVGETYPSSTVTEFIRRQLVIVTLSLMTQDEPMTECLMHDFSPTRVSGPMRQSTPTCKRQI